MIDGPLAAFQDLPPALTRLWVGAFGLVVGSFLNVVIHRVPRGLSVVRPRSSCPACGRMIRAHENVPVLSWLLLRGRCAGCGAPIAWRYPAVELLTALLFVACHESLGFGPVLLIALPFASAMLALVFIDAEHLLLPDAITLPFALAGLALSFVSPLTTPESALLGVLLAWFALEGMNLAYKLVRGRDGFGGGDTKMMFVVGAFLGWEMVLFTLVVGSFLGVLVGIPALWWSSRRMPAPGPADPAPERAAAAASGGEIPPDLAAPPDLAMPQAAVAEPVARDDGGDARPSLRELLPQSLDEMLPLVVVPACAVTWVLDGASPTRALAGLLAAIVVAWGVDAALRPGGRQSPLSRALVLLGAFAGMPARPLPLVAAAVVVLALLALFRPPALAPRAAPADDAHAPRPDERAPLLQSELPFGVFLGAAALIGLLWGDRLLDWYVEASAGLLGPVEP